MSVEIAASVTHIEGYVVLAEPLQNFPPLTLLGLMRGDNEANHLGVLTDVWPTSADAPKISAPELAASLSGMDARHLRMNVSADVMSGIFKTLGIGSAPGLAMSTERDEKVNFAYTDVKQSCASFIEAVNWLNRAESQNKMNTAAIKTYADSQQGNSLFLVTEVLLSDSIEVDDTANRSNQFSGAAAMVTQPVEGKAQTGWTDSGTTTQKFQGDNPIVFAFKASQIIFDSRGCWSGGMSDDEVARQLAMGGAKPSILNRTAGKVGHLFHHH